jgi:hypothetical protein
MKPTQQLHNLRQSLWLANITRALQTSGTLRSFTQSRDLNRRHIATEDNEVFPRRQRFFPPPTARLSEARWRPGGQSGLSLGPIPLPASRSSA